MRRVALAPILEQAVQNPHFGAGQANIRLEISDEAKDLRLVADPLRLRQVLENLISNAVKFSAEGAPIDVAADRRGNIVLICVQDRGTGIPKAFQGHVFDAFTQADSSSTRQRGGTGLGLRIAKTIVEAHRGKIGFSSAEGQGTIFFVELPLEADKSTEAGLFDTSPRVNWQAAPVR